jgi:hypothetical protein
MIWARALGLRVAAGMGWARQGYPIRRSLSQTISNTGVCRGLGWTLDDKMETFWNYDPAG